MPRRGGGWRSGSRSGGSGGLRLQIWLPLGLKTMWRQLRRAVVAPVRDPLSFSANYNRMESMFIMVAFHVVLAGVLFGTADRCGGGIDAASSADGGAGSTAVSPASTSVEPSVTSFGGSSAPDSSCLEGWGLWLLVAVCLFIVYGALLFGVAQVVLELYKALYSWEKGRRIARMQLVAKRRLAH